MLLNSTLPALVSLAGFAVAGIGLLGVAAPSYLTRRLGSSRVLTSFPVSLALRIVFGAVFVLAAPGCRLPTLVYLMGFLELGGAALLLMAGSGRLDRFVDWWLERPPCFVRSWCLGAFAFGILLAFAGA